MEHKSNKKSNGRRSRPKRRGNKSGKSVGSATRAERQPRPMSGSVANPILTVRQIPLFGLRTRKRMQYFESVAVTGTASQVYTYIYSANGVYDPNITGTGHNPMGFDQMMLFYNHYTVMGSKIRVVYQNTGTVDTHVGLSVSGSTSASTDYVTMIENGDLIYTILTPTGIAGSVATLRSSSKAADFQGLQYVMDDPDMRGDAASNPVEQLYYYISIWNPANATVPSVLIDVYIEYDVMYHEPRKAPTS